MPKERHAVSKNVRYEKKMRDRAIAEKKWLVTVSLDGRHLKDDSCCVQALVELKKAKELARIAVGLLRTGDSFITD